MGANVLTLPPHAPATLRDECEREAVIDLRAFKRERKLSAEGVAQLLGCSPDSVERWLAGPESERGCRVPGWVVVALARLRARRAA